MLERKKKAATAVPDKSSRQFLKTLLQEVFGCLQKMNLTQNSAKFIVDM